MHIRKMQKICNLKWIYAPYKYLCYIKTVVLFLFAASLFVTVEEANERESDRDREF